VTGTMTRPPRHASVSAGQPASWDAGNSGPRRTLLALLASCLGATPLKALLTDTGWLVDGWLTMVIVIAPAALIRLRRPPSALDVWPGIALLVPWLTVVFLPKHAWGGFIPTGATLTDLSHLMQSLHRTTRDEVAPIHSTVAVRLVVCTLLGLFAALIDLIAVVGRRGALAGVPLLVVFTVSGAVPRSPVAWGWFIVAAIGFLILLGLDADDDLRDWGRRISRAGAARDRPGLTVSAQRIGVAAVLVAVVLPSLVPDHTRNLIADAFHNGNGNGIGGFGAGSGGGGSISPFVALKGQLDRDTPAKLMDVHVSGQTTPVPFYLRTNVLDRYTDDIGWSVSGHGTSEPIQQTGFEISLPANPQRTTDFDATITVGGLTGNTPVFSAPRSVSGVADDTNWSPQDGILVGGTLHKGQQVSEQVAQPQPTAAELRGAPRVADGQLTRWLALPPLPKYVTDLVTKLTRTESTPYDKARALSDYFADPANNFIYSLKTEPGDSGSALVDFLKNREGYCQQYAAALAVMLRAADVPARVVLGYMHPAPDRRGDFSVTTLDAHAWVEAYFPGVGWIPFDPTPPAGLSGGKASDLSWAPHNYPNRPGDIRPRESTSAGRPQGSQSSSTRAAAGATVPTGGSSDTEALWLGLAVLALAALCLAPAGARAGRRRRRYLAARSGDAGALWTELSDTAADLGYVWSPARSPRQVSTWLARDAGPTAPALQALADAVEHQRYAPTGTDGRPSDPGGLVRGLREVADELRSRRSWRMRLRAAFWPASLGWGRVVARRLPMPRHRR
jgi:transglutaminase-like putative cysteine protease